MIFFTHCQTKAQKRPLLSVQSQRPDVVCCFRLLLHKFYLISSTLPTPVACLAMLWPFSFLKLMLTFSLVDPGCSIVPSQCTNIKVFSLFLSQSWGERLSALHSSASGLDPALFETCKADHGRPLHAMSCDYYWK